MKIIKITDVEKFAVKIIPKQPQNNKTIVESIVKNVKKNGDDAIRKYEKKFSKANLSTLRISKTEIKNAYSLVSKTELDAIRLAKIALDMGIGGPIIPASAYLMKHPIQQMTDPVAKTELEKFVKGD